jgi:hypothetical protein
MDTNVRYAPRASTTQNNTDHTQDQTPLPLRTTSKLAQMTPPPPPHGKRPHKLGRATLATTPNSTLRTRSHQETTLNNDDLSDGRDDTRRALPQRETFSYRSLSLGQYAGKLPQAVTSNTTSATGAQQSPPSLNAPTPQPELCDMSAAMGQLAFLNLTSGQNEVLQPTLPQATAPALPLQPLETRHIGFIVHGGNHSLGFQRSPDTTIARLKLEIQHRTDVLPSEQTLSFKGKIMVDLATLWDYDLKHNAINIIDLSIGMHATATPSSAPHTPRSPENLHQRL